MNSLPWSVLKTASASFKASSQKPRIHAVGDTPGQHLVVIHVHDGVQVNIADVRQLDVGQIGAPNLVGIPNLPVSEQVGVDQILRMLVSRLGRKALILSVRMLRRTCFSERAISCRRSLRVIM